MKYETEYRYGTGTTQTSAYSTRRDFEPELDLFDLSDLFDLFDELAEGALVFLTEGALVEDLFEGALVFLAEGALVDELAEGALVFFTEGALEVLTEAAFVLLTFSIRPPSVSSI
jgi:hypothetical protein